MDSIYKHGFFLQDFQRLEKQKAAPETGAAFFVNSVAV